MNYSDFFRQNVRGLKVGLDENQAAGHCPLHKDRSPSFSVNLQDGVWKCHGGECGQSGNAYRLAKLLGIDPPEEGRPQPMREVANYIYRDEQGQPLIMVKRYEPKTFRQFRFENGAWLPGLNGTRRVLYNMPGIALAQTIYLPEGEKDAETLKSWGLPATTSIGGAGKWRDEYSDTLKGKNVVILPDRDDPGQRHAMDVAFKLWGKAKAIKIVQVTAGKDVTEWRENGGTKEDLSLLVKETPILASLELVEPTLPPANQNEKKGAEVDIIRGCDVKLEPVNWLWDGWIASGKMHILAGAPGTGKTTISLGLAATITIGGRWPDGSIAPKGNILIWSGEDDPGDTLAPRLIASGADIGRIYFIRGVREGKETRTFDPAKDMDALKRTLSTIDGGVSLMIVDPIVSAVTGDSHKNAETRRSLQPLVDLAASVPCALLGISHFAKNTSGREPVDRLIGSVAFGAMARVVLVAAKSKAKEGEEGAPARLLLRAKSNIGPDDGGFKYDLHQSELKDSPGIFASSVLWGLTIEGDTREILAEAEMNEDKGGGALMEAKDFLTALLEKGPLSYKDIKKEAGDAGHSWATVRRAKTALGVEAKKTRMDGGWEWHPPRRCSTNPEDAQDAKLEQVSTFEKIEHLRAMPLGVIEQQAIEILGAEVVEVRQ